MYEKGLRCFYSCTLYKISFLSVLAPVISAPGGSGQAATSTPSSRRLRSRCAMRAAWKRGRCSAIKRVAACLLGCMWGPGRAMGQQSGSAGPVAGSARPPLQIAFKCKNIPVATRSPLRLRKHAHLPHFKVLVLLPQQLEGVGRDRDRALVDRPASTRLCGVSCLQLFSAVPQRSWHNVLPAPSADLLEGQKLHTPIHATRHTANTRT